VEQTKVYRILKVKTTPMEDDLKILKIEYLSNHWSDLIQILNLSYVEQTKVYRILKVKTTPMEDDLKILKIEYLSNH
jgi:predicted translin family RNA/ssDNA-binding protein